jgi:hypothetical protein
MKVETMPYVVIVEGTPTGQPTPHDRRYVVAWSPNTIEGTLALTSTDDRSKARVFDDIFTVFEEWSAISMVQPLRHDMMPNRPLKAINMTVEPA